jgi:hypothetical protein
MKLDNRILAELSESLVKKLCDLYYFRESFELLVKVMGLSYIDCKFGT